MDQLSDRIYQFKITLKELRPPIWRRIEVPGTYTFWDLHVAIQDVMGWWDYHLHEFRIDSPETELPVRIGSPNEEMSLIAPIIAGWELRIADYFTESNTKADYDYDFGDGWSHAVLLERIVARDPQLVYPRCTAGRRACPPEDCGGTWGYSELLRKLADPTDPEHEDMLAWLDREFDPEHFDPSEVDFEDPRERWQRAYGLEYDDVRNGPGRPN